MDFCIESKEIRKALAEIEAAEANGGISASLSLRLRMEVHCWLIAEQEYVEFCETVHPTNPYFDWGVNQNVTKRFRFKDGRLEPLEPTE